jgi:uncharacterized membrane protein
LFGHPLHPAVVHFPLGLLLSATLADLAWAAGLTADSHFGTLLMVCGLGAGLLAMGAGMIDFIRLEEKVVPHALRHSAVVGLAWCGYAVALYLRRDALWESAALPMPTIAISVLSGLTLGFGGWLGGRLVYTFGAGVSKNAP